MHGGKSGGKQTSFQESSPGGVLRDMLPFPRNKLWQRGECFLLGKLRRHSACKVFIRGTGGGHVGTLCLSHIQIPDSREESRNHTLFVQTTGAPWALLVSCRKGNVNIRSCFPATLQDAYPRSVNFASKSLYFSKSHLFHTGLCTGEMLKAMAGDQRLLDTQGLPQKPPSSLQAK